MAQPQPLSRQLQAGQGRPGVILPGSLQAKRPQGLLKQGIVFATWPRGLARLCPARTQLGTGDAVSECAMLLAPGLPAWPPPANTALGGMEGAWRLPSTWDLLPEGPNRLGKPHSAWQRKPLEPGPAVSPGAVCPRGPAPTPTQRSGLAAREQPGGHLVLVCRTKPRAAPLSWSPSPVINSFSRLTAFPCCHIAEAGGNAG